MRLLTVLIAALALGAPALALDCTWVGASSDWESASNWSCNEVPDVDDVVTISTIFTVTLSSPTSVAGLTLANGILQGSHDLTVTGAFVWSGGTYGGAGTTVVDGAASLQGSSKRLNDNRTIVLDGGGTWSDGGLIMESGSVLRIPPSATLDVTAGVGDRINRGLPLTVEPVLDVEGTLRRSAGADEFEILVNAEVTGTVDIDAGGLVFGADMLASGTFAIAAGAELAMSSGAGTGFTKTFAGASISGPGTFGHVSNGAETTLGAGTVLGTTLALHISAGTLTHEAGSQTVGSLTQTGGTFTGTSDLTVAGPLAWSAGFQSGGGTTTVGGIASLEGSPSKRLEGDRTLALAGGGVWSDGSLVMGSGAVLHIPPNATLDITAGASDEVVRASPLTVEPVLDVDGTLRRSVGTGAVIVGINASLGGLVDVRAGTLRFTGNSTNHGVMTTAAGARLEFGKRGAGFGLHTNASDGTISGSGTVEVLSFPAATLTNDGTFAPGHSPGILAYENDFTMSASAVLDIELGGTEPGDDYDQLAVSGDATLGGTLRLRSALGTPIGAGDTFTVLTATGTIVGTFDLVEAPPGYAVDVTYNANDVVAEVLTVPNFDLVAQNTNPTGDPIVVPKGGAIQFAYAVTNNTAASITGNVWYTAKLGSTTLAEAVILSGTIPANTSSPALNFTQPVPGVAPVGTYTYTINIGQFPSTVADQEPFTVIVVPALAREAEGGADEWLAREATPWLGADGSVLMAVAEQNGAAEAETEEAAEVAVATVPDAFGLAAAYPNPFRSSTTFALDVPEAAQVSVAVYDALGRRVAVLLDAEVEPGAHRVSFDGSRLASGLYLVRATGAGATAMQRVTLVR